MHSDIPAGLPWSGVFCREAGGGLRELEVFMRVDDGLLGRMLSVGDDTSHPTERTRGKGTPRPNAPALQTLILHHSTLTAPSLNHLHTHAPHLTHLTLRYRPPPAHRRALRYPSDTHGFLPPATMRTLSADFKGLKTCVVGPWAAGMRVGDLAGLPAGVRTLSVTIGAGEDTDGDDDNPHPTHSPHRPLTLPHLTTAILPTLPNLHTLHLTFPPPTPVFPTSTFLSERALLRIPAHAPALRLVTLDIPHGANAHNPVVFFLRDSAEDGGVTGMREVYGVESEGGSFAVDEFRMRWGARWGRRERWVGGKGGGRTDGCELRIGG
ncbi:uncharacterized protein EV422DRAFT_534216 [Fimicolochytrium jonesii]|uniref:uncharacterized protein n=1 Tax=Fimicolochytrium jonesii TaxID=1396493 RepID=UPI0022FF3447|nr:uncharacterized protein EV422DRAFT_534216 [Fimicolochytrium jonesii]KAI8819754.1 hypothetical protein EV422DRAFT_534216 [Fimicolochytrium jonesii]